MAEHEAAEEAERARIKEKIDKLAASNFKQQRLGSWRPVPSDFSNMLTFVIFSIVFLLLGGAIFTMSNAVFEQVSQYDEACGDMLQTGKTCSIDLDDITTTVKGPVYLYYQLDNFYQNHRRYVKSRDYSQLLGEYIPVAKLGDCDPVIQNKDLYTNQQISVSKEKLDPEGPAIPCGLVAKSLFNDTFVLKKDGSAITISEKNIAWASDLQYKFNNIENGPKNWKDIQWIDMEDEHFVVWMRTAGLPIFRKLWGRIEQDLTPGKYTVEIQNNFEVRPFKGKKSVVLATGNVLGGKNYFLAISFLAVGGAAMFFAFLLCICSMGKSKSN